MRISRAGVAVAIATHSQLTGQGQGRVAAIVWAQKKTRRSGSRDQQGRALRLPGRDRRLCFTFAGAMRQKGDNNAAPPLVAELTVCTGLSV